MYIAIKLSQDTPTNKVCRKPSSRRSLVFPSFF